MDYNLPKFYYKLRQYDEGRPLKSGRTFQSHPDITIDILYKDTDGEKGWIEIKEGVQKKDQIKYKKFGQKLKNSEYENEGYLLVSSDLYDFNNSSRAKEPTELLILLNLTEYNKLNELIDYCEQTRKSIENDSIAIDALNAQLENLYKFKISIIQWFNKKRVAYPKKEVQLSDDDPLCLIPKEIKTITEKVKYLVMKAREDKSEGSHLKWENVFQSNFEDIYVYLNRIKADFVKENHEEKFNINGMAWYNKRKYYQ